MKHRFAWMIAVALCCHAGVRGATVVVSVTGDNPSNEQDIRLDGNSLAAVHWTSTITYSNVTVAAELYCTPCTTKADATFAEAYLMTKIGPTATLADQVAFARVRVAGGRSMVPLFSGLTLVAGDYYLVIYSPFTSQGGPLPPGSAVGQALAWGGTSNANASVVLAPRTTRETMLIYSSNSTAPLINPKFPPSSFFFRSPTTPDYDLNGAYNLKYQVTSIPSVVIPQVISGGGWKTSFGIVNLDQSPVTYGVKFWGDDGQPLSISLAPGGAEVSGTLPPGGAYYGETSSTATTLLQGWAEVIASGRVGAFVVVRQNLSGKMASEVSYTGDATLGALSLMFDNTQGFVTTLALANANPTLPLTITFLAQLEDGSQRQGSVSIPARGHSAFALTTLMPGLANARGILRISTTVPDMAVKGFRFDPGGSFSALPAFE